MPTSIVDQTIKSRHAVRAFSAQTVALPLLQQILEVARFAPSGTNMQPWQLYVVTGAAQAEISRQVTSVADRIFAQPELAQQYQEVFAHYPSQWFEPYLQRRRTLGWQLYDLVNIGKGEKEKMHRQQRRNFEFFDAPIGIFITTDKKMGDGVKLDIGMLMQNIMLAAKARGLDTCPQTAWNQFHRLVLPLLGATADEILVSCICLGYADSAAAVNSLRSEREDVDSFTKWLL